MLNFLPLNGRRALKAILPVMAGVFLGGLLYDAHAGGWRAAIGAAPIRLAVLLLFGAILYLWRRRGRTRWR